jgi:hypothetical protein
VAETFTLMASDSGEDHNYLMSQVIISVDLDMTTALSPISFLRVPYMLLNLALDFIDKARYTPFLNAGTDTNDSGAHMHLVRERTVEASGGRRRAAPMSRVLTRRANLRCAQSVDKALSVTESKAEQLEKDTSGEMFQQLREEFTQLKNELRQGRAKPGQPDQKPDQATAGMTKASPEQVPKPKVAKGYEVQAFDGFTTEASRLIFHYSLNFQQCAPHSREPSLRRGPSPEDLPRRARPLTGTDKLCMCAPHAPLSRRADPLPWLCYLIMFSLPKRPVLTTIIPSGQQQGKGQELKVKVGDVDNRGDEGESVEKLTVRAIGTYPFAQKVPKAEGRRIINESGSTVVRLRLNGEYGLSQIWTFKVLRPSPLHSLHEPGLYASDPTPLFVWPPLLLSQVNDEFNQNFRVSYTNPNIDIFNPQAVVEVSDAGVTPAAAHLSLQPTEYHAAVLAMCLALLSSNTR